MSLDAQRTGDALAVSAPDLARVWRAGRAAARPHAFPGLLDGVLESFLAALGGALAGGRDPALVWSETGGVVRLPRDARRAREELEAEWDLVEEVLDASLQALRADAAAAEWIGRAVVFARAGTRSLAAGGAWVRVADGRVHPRRRR